MSPNTFRRGEGEETTGGWRPLPRKRWVSPCRAVVRPTVGGTPAQAMVFRFEAMERMVVGSNAAQVGDDIMLGGGEHAVGVHQFVADVVVVTGGRRRRQAWALK